jgi:hypothetical protein
MKKQSKVIEIISLVWNGLDYSSHQRVNQGMADLLNNLINIGVKFEKNDITDAYNSFRGGYWFGVNPNGKGKGDGFYMSACGSNPNISAAQSFEEFTGRKPFLLNGKRLALRSEFTMDKLYYSVTGFDDEQGLIYAVGYTNRMSEGKRKLLKLTNEEFLIVRKEMKEL